MAFLFNLAVAILFMWTIWSVCVDLQVMQRLKKWLDI